MNAIDILTGKMDAELLTKTTAEELGGIDPDPRIEFIRYEPAVHSTVYDSVAGGWCDSLTPNRIVVQIGYGNQSIWVVRDMTEPWDADTAEGMIQDAYQTCVDDETHLLEMEDDKKCAEQEKKTRWEIYLQRVTKLREEKRKKFQQKN